MKKTKKIGTLSLALTFAGCFLGAGYLSGKELWQYFGSYGKEGFIGLALTLALQFAFGLILIFLARETGIRRLDELIIRKNIPPLRAAVAFVSLFFMFGVFVIMAAGAGSLLNRVTGIDKTVCCAVFCIVVALFSCFGIRGMVKVFSLIVPLLTVSCIIISIIWMSGGKNIDLNAGQTNPLLGSWPLSSVNYAAYNLFGTIGMLAPVALEVKNKKTCVKGVILGAGVLAAIAVPIILSLASSGEITKADLPMLELSFVLSGICGAIYAVLLFGGMLGTSVSSLVAVTEYASQSFSFFKKHRIIVTIVLSILAFIGSLAGFGELVGTVYPICGYFGIIALALISEHFIHIKRKKKSDS